MGLNFKEWLVLGIILAVLFAFFANTRGTGCAKLAPGALILAVLFAALLILISI